jgi:tetratricopeptide (TPR) repeat protein
MPPEEQYLDIFTFSMTEKEDYFTKTTTATFTPYIYPRVKLEKNEHFLIIGGGTVREVDSFYALGSINYPHDYNQQYFIKFTTLPKGSKHFVEGEKALWKKDKNSTNNAITAFTKAIKANPEFVSAYIRRGDVYTEKGDYNNALSDYNKALEIAPNNLNIYKSRGKMYLKKKEYNTAITDFSHVIEITKSLDDYQQRAYTYREMGEYEKAVSDYTQCINIWPGFFPYRGRGQVYYMWGDYEKAVSDFSQAINISTDYTAYLWRGKSYHMLGDYEKAADDYSNAIKDSYSWNEYGKEPKELLEKAKARQPLVTQ